MSLLLTALATFSEPAALVLLGLLMLTGARAAQADHQQVRRRRDKNPPAGRTSSPAFGNVPLQLP